MISERTIGRLSLYRRILEQARSRGASHLFSHQLAERAGCTSAQVRRDLMSISTEGTPTRGYDVEKLLDGLNSFLEGSCEHRVALVGIGNLGRALLAYFASRRANLQVVAAFDRDPERTGRVIYGCRCYAVEDMERQVRQEAVTVAILAVPGPEAQGVADQLVRLGIKGILNFAPVPIQTPADVYVENMDMTMALEKVAFFAHRNARATGGARPGPGAAVTQYAERDLIP